MSKVTGDIVKRQVATKLVRDVPAPRGEGIVTEDVPAELQNQPCVTDEEILRLVEVAKEVEQHYGVPQDLEWAICEGIEGPDTFVLQSRPETVWAAKDAERPTAAPAAKAFHHVLAKFGGAAKAPQPDDRGEDG